jgi:hypothetical protein
MVGTSVVHDRLAADLPINSIVAPAIVDDPMGLNPGDKITVLRSLRDDPLAAMRASGQIDDVLYLAGRGWQRDWDLAQIGGVQAVDPSKEYVDGGQPKDPLCEVQIRASEAIRMATRALGLEGSALIHDVLGAGMTLRVAADRRGATAEREWRYIGRRFRECLETLAVEQGLAMKKRAGT